MRAVVAVIQPEPVPVNGRRVVALVFDVDHDLRALLDLEDRTRDRVVVGQHSHLGPGEVLDHRRYSQIELVSIAKLDWLRGLRLGKPGDLGRKVL
jgi:hypothetical protein